MQKFKKFIVLCLKWIGKSSVNVDKWSLTLKGILISVIPAVVIITKAYNLEFTNEVLTQLVNDFIATITVLAGGIGALYTGFGALRKIFMTIVGENEVLKKNL